MSFYGTDAYGLSPYGAGLDTVRYYFITNLLNHLADENFYAAKWSTDTDVYRLIQTYSEELATGFNRSVDVKNDLFIDLAQTSSLFNHHGVLVNSDKIFQQNYDEDFYTLESGSFTSFRNQISQLFQGAVEGSSLFALKKVGHAVSGVTPEIREYYKYPRFKLGVTSGSIDLVPATHVGSVSGSARMPSKQFQPNQYSYYSLQVPQNSASSSISIGAVSNPSFEEGVVGGIPSNWIPTLAGATTGSIEKSSAFHTDQNFGVKIVSGLGETSLTSSPITLTTPLSGSFYFSIDCVSPFSSSANAAFLDIIYGSNRVRVRPQIEKVFTRIYRKISVTSPNVTASASFGVSGSSQTLGQAYYFDNFRAGIVEDVPIVTNDRNTLYTDWRYTSAFSGSGGVESGSRQYLLHRSKLGAQKIFDESKKGLGISLYLWSSKLVGSFGEGSYGLGLFGLSGERYLQILNLLEVLKPAHTDLNVKFLDTWAAHTTTAQFNSGSFNPTSAPSASFGWGGFSVKNGTLTFIGANNLSTGAFATYDSITLDLGNNYKDYIWDYDTSYQAESGSVVTFSVKSQDADSNWNVLEFKSGSFFNRFIYPTEIKRYHRWHLDLRAPGSGSFKLFQFSTRARKLEDLEFPYNVEKDRFGATTLLI